MKITITFELEFENSVTEADKMATLHKIDQAVETLKPMEMVKRTVIAYPFCVRGWRFTPDRYRASKSNHPLGIDPSLFKHSISDFKREYYNNPIPEGLPPIAKKDIPIPKIIKKYIRF